MKNFRLFIFLGLTVLLAESCYKGEMKMRHNVSGLYDVSEVRMEYYTRDDIPDSTREFADLGVVSLTDAGKETTNPFVVYFDADSTMPQMFQKYGDGNQLTYHWGLDGNSDKRIYFSGYFGATFTIEKLNSRKIKMERVLINDTTNTIIYRELITLKRH